MKTYITVLGAALSLAACTEEKIGDSRPLDKQVVDNTANNKGDEKSTAVTPTDQKENERDLELTQRIRQNVIADDSLSFSAKNAKIIAQDGKVTLRGAVETDHDRTVIGNLARQTAGNDAVVNQLEVKK